MFSLRFASMKACSRCGKDSGEFFFYKSLLEKFLTSFFLFRPYYFRLGPHTVITFILMEQMNTAYNKYNGIVGGSGL